MALIALTRMTLADSMRQPVTWLMTGISLVLLVLSYSFGMFNFEAEDRMRMLSTAGVAVAVLNGLFLAVVGVSQSVHDELASRTALTLFAKPLGRGTFLVGKALGTWLTVVVAGLVLVAVHAALLWVGGRTGFDDALDLHAPSVNAVAVPWQPVLIAHGLGMLHGGLLACVATVLALRLALVANILECFALFVVGHLLAGMKLTGAVVIPALALFNIDDAIQIAGQPLGWSYVASTALYTVLFAAGSMLIGLAMFQRQDIP
jgi:hypothetical protein